MKKTIITAFLLSASIFCYAEEESQPPTLSSFRVVTGITNHIMKASLQFRHSSSRGLFSKGSSSTTQNYLFLNTDTLQSYWLFPDNKQIIADSDVLQKSQLNPDTNRNSYSDVAVFYQTIDTDTNGDSQLSKSDKVSLAYSLPDGKEYTTVIRDVDRVLGSKSIDDYKRHVVIYSKNGQWHSAVISLSTFKIEKEAELDTPVN